LTVGRRRTPRLSARLGVEVARFDRSGVGRSANTADRRWAAAPRAGICRVGGLPPILLPRLIHLAQSPYDRSGGLLRLLNSARQRIPTDRHVRHIRHDSHLEVGRLDNMSGELGRFDSSVGSEVLTAGTIGPRLECRTCWNSISSRASDAGSH
jgi:hypothetical protein